MQQVDKKAVVCVDKFGVPVADDLMGKEKEKWTIRDYVVMSLKPKLESQLAEFQALLDKQMASVNKDLQQKTSSLQDKITSAQQALQKDIDEGLKVKLESLD